MYAGIYIRKENEYKWLAIENKSDWINARLDHKTVSASNRLVKAELPLETRKVIAAINAPSGKAFIVPSETLPTIDIPVGLLPEDAYQEIIDGPVLTTRNKDMNFCKHNAVKGLCKKGCK